MTLGIRYLVAYIVVGSILRVTGFPLAEEGTAASQKRAVTMADAISMTRVAGTAYPYFSPKSGFAVFSPNGQYFAVVVAKGDLKHNLNEYSLLLFRSAEVFHRAVPKKLTAISSSSNRAGISDVKWLDDNDTILFLASRGTQAAELYSIQRVSRKLSKLTSHPTSLVSYAVSKHGDTVVYAAERSAKRVIDQGTLRHGFDIKSEQVSDLIRGQIVNREPELFLKRAGSQTVRPLKTLDPFDSGVNDLFLSPDKAYLVLKTDATELRENWRQYDDSSIQTVFRRSLSKGVPTRILHYELINLRTGKSEILLDAPTTYSSSDVLWSSDSKSLLLCGTYLPLNVKDPAHLQARRTSKFVVEVRLDSRDLTEITNENLRPVRWNARTNIAQFASQAGSAQGTRAPEIVYYRKVHGQWEKLATVRESAGDLQPQVFVDEDLNKPPQIVAADPQAKRRTVLLDLNPQFVQLAFGREEEIHWATGGGAILNGGLYLPPDYTPGRRYPLVIQTHGFDSHSFWIDGPYSSAFAAQALAGRGIIVLQMNDILSETMDTTKETNQVMRAYESAIDYLDERGIVDPRRVGLIGFSRTCLYVKYTLTHSTHHFAAALVSDGVDAGYFQYLLSYNTSPLLASEFETIIGGPPFGEGLSLWLKNSPGFLLDKVQTPLLIQAMGPVSILGEWQWFEGLKRLGKPVDMVYLPTGTHVLTKPWDRIVSQQESVDWFCFWLRGEENPLENPGLYSRWRGLGARSALSREWPARSDSD